MNFTYDRIRVILEVLKSHIVTERVPVDAFRFMACGYKSGEAMPSPDASGWHTFGDMGTLGRQEGYARLVLQTDFDTVFDAGERG